MQIEVTIRSFEFLRASKSGKRIQSRRKIVNCNKMATKYLSNVITKSHFVQQILKKQLSTIVNKPKFMGIESKFTTQLEFKNKDSYEQFPIYTMMSEDDKCQDLKLDENILKKMYIDMVTLAIMDSILYESQRQGRISFYMTNSGEEAIQIGSAAALDPKDTVYAQYREPGVLLWRGFKLIDFMNQCYGNCDDLGKGRQMPVHYGSKELNFFTISSPLTTQMPQAVGAAYAKKLRDENSCVICYFGEGASSEGDAHAGFNFAATLDCPIIFICRNNGYAISTPSLEQYRGDGIAARGPAYGIATTRVDGNDILAMYHATQEARKYCLENKKPVLIEAMSYRYGHHSTSDDSTAYRHRDEISSWNAHLPVLRLKNYLQRLNLWTEEEEVILKQLKKKEILTAFSDAEKKLKPNWKEMFNDVYKEVPDHITRQIKAMEKHIQNYSEHYPLKSFSN